ncbi:MAG: desulfoferrodoxin FeS4 iron-binding domain-containing protein [Erysipelotrichaceae bacterium]|nr:desulfoferrodoxin FeS4 iron-binding domain-containing protein [Erysipelotrichaceae bacterium]
MQAKFYRCNHCGNIIEMVHASGVPVICCGEPMKELVANTVDAAVEKHVPYVVVEGNMVKVQVGEVEHPMIPEHYIQWIYLHTNKGIQRKELTSAEKPYAEFCLAQGEEVIAVYEYCNLHGLWKKEL